MKKIILALATFVLISHASIAQKSENGLNFGLKFGANLSNIYDSKTDQFTADNKYGLAIGAFAALPLGKFLGIQPEVLFSQKGFKGTGTLLGSTYNFTRTTNFIDVPILLAIKPVSFLTILGGPQFSFLLKQKDEFVTSLTSVQQEQVFQTDNLRKNIFGFTGGIDLNLERIVIGARAGWDVQNNNGDGTTTTPRYKNVWYQATIGFRFL
ncbi:MAG: porin family protein [Bacteroidota bacterium]